MGKQVKVEIREKGWGGYTGPLGSYQFVDGKSVDSIPIRAALRIGGSIEAYDENGTRLHPSTYIVTENPSSVGATSVSYATPIDESPQPAYEPETAESKANEIDLTPIREMVGGKIKETYSRAQLEAIADKKGIEGLREIGDKHGVKGRAVVELIGKILEAQA
jgi:hypothetical protein